MPRKRPNAAPELPDVPEHTADRPSRKRRIMMILGIIVLVVASVWGVRWWLHARHFESTDNAFIDGDVLPVSARVAGHVLRVLVDDNQTVAEGEALVKLDPRDFDVMLKQAQAALNTAQANVAQAEADVASDEARANLATTELKRFTQMLATNSASKQEFDNAVASEKVALADLNAARKKVSAMQALVLEAQASVQRAELNLSYTTIVAARAGRVTKKTVEPGEYVQPGQTLLAVVPDEVWVTANLKETQLTDIRTGQPVDLRVDAYPSMRLKGIVDSIQSGTGARFSLFPPENATGNYVKVVQRVPVKILLKDATDEELKLLAPGLSVEPEIKVR